MEHLRLGLGTIWLFFTIVATALLGTDFVLNEIRTALQHRRESDTK